MEHTGRPTAVDAGTDTSPDGAERSVVGGASIR